MPKLSKIRLTGCKYEGLRKEHENSIFDLTKDGNPDHALFTLVNGGGKGVMMQFIFQLLLPETRWGKNNGNKIISTFYDKKGNPHYFTFHVVLEWVLDTTPERRLLTGIAMKPVLKNVNIDEEQTGLYYFLYTYEYDNNGHFTIYNLPLYEESTGDVTDIDEFENFIDANKRDFIKYSQSSVKRKDGDYYRYLESRGIYRSEWVNLKAINKSEGGAGDYFIGASDNKAIFDKIIIPAISENIRNYSYDDGDNLVEMFKSNLSITKDLPILIKREGDYKGLLVEIEPLIENADSGSRFIDIRDRLIQEGNDIYYILNDEFNKKEQEIEKWTNEKDKTEEERRSLEFKKDNIYYNIDFRELKRNQEEALNLENTIKEKSIEIEEYREELKLYKINKVLYYKGKTEGEIQYKLLEKERLINALGISDIKEKALELEDEIELEWEKLKKQWLNYENQYIGYINYTNQIIENNNNKIKKYNLKKSQLQNEINKFEIKKEHLNKKKLELEKYYDAMSLAFPERIVEDLDKLKIETEEIIESLISEINSLKEKIITIKEEINKLNYIKEQKEKDLEALNKKIEIQEKLELEIAKRISKQLLESYDGALLNHNWFLNKGEELKFLENKKREDLEKIQRTIWEKNIDKSLNKEEYFVPNKDVFKIKDEIKQLGIHVETGTEFLNSLDEEEEKNHIIDKFPGLIYSLVIGNERDWELVQRNLDSDIFLNNLVPIYIRSEMKEGDSSFKILFGKAYELVNIKNYTNWKNAMEVEIERLCETEEKIKEDLKNINELNQELVHISKIDTSFILKQKYREIEKSILDNSNEIRIKEEELLNLNNKLNIEKTKLEENDKKLEEINVHLVKLEDYIEELKEIQLEESKIHAIKKEMEEMNTEISNIDFDSDKILEGQNEIKNSYYEWKVRTENIINDAKMVFHGIDYNISIDANYLSSSIPNFSVSGELFLSLINERRLLEEDIVNRNVEIVKIDKDIEYFKKEVQGYISDLERIDKNWSKYLYLGKSLNEINIHIDEIERNINFSTGKSSEFKSKLDRVNGSIDIMKKAIKYKEDSIFKKYKKAPLLLDIENLSSELDLVERDIKSNENYMKVCMEGIEKSNNRFNRLELNLSKIKSGYELDLMKGKMDKILKEKLEDNIDLVVDEWCDKCEKNKGQMKRTIDEGERYRLRFIKEVDEKLEEDRLKKQIISVVKEANIENFKNNYISFLSMKGHFQNEILSLSRDKEKAENAMKQWTNRAAIHVIRMVEALKDMVNSMNYTNEQGYVFPLVKLKGAERLPKEEGDIIHLLEEYFVEAITEVLEIDEDIENLDNKKLNEIMGDGAIFSKALQGRYPTLLVYKMSEDNEFRYARPRDEYYTSWEAIIKGEGYSPEGSGGQTLSVTTFMIMMIMSFKKKHIGNENPSTVLILDNPFGKASGKHVLDPIFEIADKLNFQLICFAAPEIIKAEISERFPIFWDLKIENGKIIYGGRIIRE